MVVRTMTDSAFTMSRLSPLTVYTLATIANCLSCGWVFTSMTRGDVSCSSMLSGIINPGRRSTVRRVTWWVVPPVFAASTHPGWPLWAAIALYRCLASALSPLTASARAMMRLLQRTILASPSLGNPFRAKVPVSPFVSCFGSICWVPPSGPAKGPRVGSKTPLAWLWAARSVGEGENKYGAYETVSGTLSVPPSALLVYRTWTANGLLLSYSCRCRR